MADDYSLDPRFIAGVQLLERTGARNFRVGWSDDDDGPPVVFYAVCTWRAGRHPMVGDGAEAMAALDPVEAVMRLCERVIDGGICTHCGRSTVLDPNPNVDPVVDGILDAMGCRYKWDAESATFRRSCEGTDGEPP